MSKYEIGDRVRFNQVRSIAAVWDFFRVTITPELEGEIYELPSHASSDIYTVLVDTPEAKGVKILVWGDEFDLYTTEMRRLDALEAKVDEIIKLLKGKGKN